MNIYDCSAQEGNCYTGCAYMCYRKRRNNLAQYRINKNGMFERTGFRSDMRFSSGAVPDDGYYVYCPKNPTTGFDIIETINDEQNLLNGIFHTKFIFDRNISCPCFDSKFNYGTNPLNSLSKIQDNINIYQRM